MVFIAERLNCRLCPQGDKKKEVDCHITGWFIPAPRIATQKASVGIYSIVDVIIPTNLVNVLFGPAIPTSSFNFIVFIHVLVQG
jgi:hypothetical protein